MSATEDDKLKESLRLNALDASLNLYTLDEGGLAFMKAQTGIEDDEELEKHILAVRAEGYAVLAVRAEGYAIYPYPCLRRFSFLEKLPAYGQLLALGKQRKDPIFLDIGCCLGYDMRKAIADGFPMGSAIAADLHPEFWELGHKLFKSTPETFPVPFIPGDAFDPAFLEPVPPFYAHSPPREPRPDLSALASLNPLRGHVSAIHASSFFHLFDEARQAQLARALACLLSPEPGSMLLGGHSGLAVPGLRRMSAPAFRLFAHSPESWAELWDGQVFEKGTVRVDAVLHEVMRPDVTGVPEGTRFHFLWWSVTRM